jgi:hypothetical protein
MPRVIEHVGGEAVLTAATKHRAVLQIHPAAPAGAAGKIRASRPRECIIGKTPLLSAGRIIHNIS